MPKREPDETPRIRAFARLAQAVSNGVYLPGEIIRIADVAHELGLSGTPVREALCRLAGARVVEDRQREGFRMARLTSDEIAAAYRLEAQVYQGIIDGMTGDEAILSRGARNPDEDRFILAPGTPAAFTILQRTTANALLRALAIDLGTSLAPYRIWEGDVVPDAAAEPTRLDAAVARKDWPTASNMLVQYAARRAGFAHRLHVAGSRRRQ